MPIINYEKILDGARSSRSPTNQSSNDLRDPFENDYDRLIHSFHVRRLQDKTQVVPLIKSDFVRTRLTHSHEVAAIGKSMGKAIGAHLYGNLEKSLKLAHAVESACLIHDLGNPPFGHFGEVAINLATKSLLNEFKDHFSNVPKTLLNELEEFDGNAQNIRIALNLHVHKLDLNERGYNLTYSTLLTLLKYPRKHSDTFEKKGFHKKIGYFFNDVKVIEEGQNILGINKNRRHPATFILEAADDIAYSAADLEDGIRMKLVTIDDLKLIFNNLPEKFLEVKNFIKEYPLFKDNYGEDGINIWAGGFRVLTQRIMITEAIECFTKNKDNIFMGNFEYDLLEASNASELRKAFKEVQKLIFDFKPILEVELKGKRSIEFFFRLFGSALFEENDGTYEDMIQRLSKSKEYKILSSTQRKVFEFFCIKDFGNSPYYKVRLIQDYVSGMTDSFCDNLYKKLC